MRRSGVLAAAMAVLLAGSAVAATAATTTGFAQWGPLTGSTNDYATTMQLPAVGFPEATVASDSRADVALPSGATNWFGASTPPGQRYGSSRDQAYLNLRPRADNASSPSTTTYTFDRPTPQGWTVVLGDVDADQVRVSATRADGTAATTADLGFRSAFNLCDTTPRPSSVCSDTGRPKDVPTWDPATATLRGNDAAVDSDGATGWFEPTTSLRTLTFTFTRRAGLPIFQTWFAVAKQDVSGTVAVTTGTCSLASATVSLVDASGAVVATRSVDASGTYAFDGVAASDGYRVALSGVPATCLVTGPSSRAIDLRAGDAVADFSVRQAVPVPITGEVRAASGPLEGVTVTLTPVAGGPSRTTTTDVSGRYVFEDNADDADYTIAVTAPAGYLPAPDRTATVPAGATTPVTDQDFVLQALPTVSGVVAGPDGPLAGVTVELTGGGSTYRAVTAADGTYALPRVPAGAYVLAVPNPPAGYLTPAASPVTVGTADVPDQDVVLSRVAATGSVAGTVTLDGRPLPGAVVTVAAAGVAGTTVTTDAEGTFGIGALAPGTYRVTVAAPAGTSGGAARTVTITVAGEDLTGQDFALVTAPVTSDPVVPAPDDPSDSAADPTSDDDGGSASDDGAVLPDSGGPPLALPLLGLALTTAGAVAVVAARPRRG
ncbi:carboxypeptidase-like regulatory domain-containing protein [Aeromicrobium fastidiosum]|uniref:MSCRAMM family protein n=1 Tax=Aeromicrobium fastidiosum TaxID=52699 RepID=UPI00202327D9|nr:carboxypeptidase-like regulatory domain-containing protein [Aeromicrobium fastidiosum]MCL8251660.1 carboxypeptidase-like regulatory domain-containing protein [Aeromicrobium fastidiosum]